MTPPKEAIRRRADDVDSAPGAEHFDSVGGAFFNRDAALRADAVEARGAIEAGLSDTGVAPSPEDLLLAIESEDDLDS